MNEYHEFQTNIPVVPPEDASAARELQRVAEGQPSELLAAIGAGDYSALGLTKKTETLLRFTTAMLSAMEQDPLPMFTPEQVRTRVERVERLAAGAFTPEEIMIATIEGKRVLADWIEPESLREVWSALIVIDMQLTQFAEIGRFIPEGDSPVTALLRSVVKSTAAAGVALVDQLKELLMTRGVFTDAVAGALEGRDV